MSLHGSKRFCLKNRSTHSSPPGWITCASKATWKFSIRRLSREPIRLRRAKESNEPGRGQADHSSQASTKETMAVGTGGCNGRAHCDRLGAHSLGKFGAHLKHGS